MLCGTHTSRRLETELNTVALFKLSDRANGRLGAFTPLAGSRVPKVIWFYAVSGVDRTAHLSSAAFDRTPNTHVSLSQSLRQTYHSRSTDVCVAEAPGDQCNGVHAVLVSNSLQVEMR